MPREPKQEKSSDSFAGAIKPQRAVSPLLLRILAVNVMALAILVGGILYLGNYQERIVQTELKEMSAQARIVASAIAENAIVIDPHDRKILSPLLGRMMVRRLADTTENRTRLFSVSETLLADSHNLAFQRRGRRGVRVETSDDDLVETESLGARLIEVVFDAIDFVRDRQSYPIYDHEAFERGSPANVTSRALQGEIATQVWRLPRGGLILEAAVPIGYGRHTLGAVMMSRTARSINSAVYSVRINILQIFFMTLCVTILFSIYLAHGIATPIRQLAQAAESLRQGQKDRIGRVSIASLLTDKALPDMTARHDEIGDLSGVLRSLTTALARRVSDIENFAADVAHELKNPMTSLRSAVETIEKVQDPEAQKKLMLIIRDDVDRMTRLVTDISSASRLDAELGRAEFSAVDLGAIFGQIESYYRFNDAKEGKPARVEVARDGNATRVVGVPGRLLQVFQNLIDNALSFSPEDEPIRIVVTRDDGWVQVAVEDRGPGVPENKREAIFDRFYTERPKKEKFGMHSGLGLSISKQIVEAHHGRIWAENRKNDEGGIIGARFVVQLPAMDE